MMERSDKYEFQINENTGLIDYQDNESIKHKVQVPYALKMLIQEQL